MIGCNTALAPNYTCAGWPYLTVPQRHTSGVVPPGRIGFLLHLDGIVTGYDLGGNRYSEV
jgi:hypothetical protein